ncbi:MAG: hypothetical protein WCJ35_17085 [Planctomycetota bacterium]
MLDNLVVPLSIAAWVVQESYYPDLRIRQEFESALRFGGVDTLAPTGNREVLMLPSTETGRYDVVARVLHADEEIYVIDCGLRAYTLDTGYDEVEQNEFVTGNVGFGVDPYDYREFWSKRLGIPLIYRWQIERILESRPHRSFAECGNGTVFYDRSNWFSVDVDSTDSSDESTFGKDCHPSWELYCRLLSPEPRLSRPDELLI